MKTTLIFSLAACGGLAVFGGGCATEPESHLVSAPPPAAPTAAPVPVQVVVAPAPQVIVTQPATVVTAAPAVAAGTTSYIVMQAPPAPQPPAAMPAQPTSQHAWIPGFWTWRNSRYEWMAGHWEVPPFAGAVWQNPRWVPESGSYRFYEGYWN